MANATPLTKKQWLELLRKLWQESLQNYEPVAYYKEGELYDSSQGACSDSLEET